ncbi:aldo/keto reductase [Acuticoccus sediminis]|uniref:Aldo/keto reductase n=1 Tax=Acuticoccus sediminis TaxID=2184697 RepID=A0A8B2NIJ7_9HYPH|nr:aldo/keto reductase [Acuticoccus sediminis]RAH96942.1 aldo/keto reductase [Acuticoccus sediminis]
MEYSPLGQSGMMVSKFVFGTVTFAGTHGFHQVGSTGVDDARLLIDMAIDADVNAFDTANIYSRGDSEIVLGEAIHDRRDDVLVFTKVRTAMGDGPNDRGASRVHIMRQIDASLKRLKTDWIDLYWVHQWDGVTPVEETVGTMQDLIRAGKIRYWGVSNYSGWQLAKTVMTARMMGAPQPIAQQINYTPEARQAEYELLPAGEDLGVGAMIWSPLGEGLLTGRIDRDTPPAPGTRQADWPEPHIIDTGRLWDVIDVLKGVAAEVGRSVPQVVLAWLRDRPNVHSIVLGARTAAHLEDNLGALDLTLTPEQAARIEIVGRPAAIFPLWHRALNGMDRVTEAERSYLEGHREAVLGGLRKAD